MTFHSSRLHVPESPSQGRPSPSSRIACLKHPSTARVDGPCSWRSVAPGSTSQSPNVPETPAQLLTSIRLEHRFSSLSLSIQVRHDSRSLQGPSHSPASALHQLLYFSDVLLSSTSASSFPLSSRTPSKP